jgi:site-specific DNA recombinase
MYVPSNSPKYVCTGCRNKIPIMDLEAVFLEELKNYLVSPDKVAAYLKAANATIGEKAQLLETLRNELQKVKQQADQTYQLYLQHGLTVEQFKEIYQPLDTRKRQIETEIPCVEAEVDLLKIDEFSSEQIMAEAHDFHSRWPKMNPEERRKIIELIVKSIVIGHGEITLNLCYLPSFKEMPNRQRMV